jgi:histidyl-tRNA synthetase
MASEQFRTPKGASDILPEEQSYWRFFQKNAEEAVARFGYSRLDTPMFEDARLFIRTAGEVTDIVENETYTFEDRGGDMLTLRPEGTAPVCRSYLEHGMFNLPQPVRLHYFMPMFRYDRPQAGRYRQLHQLGVEAIGDSDPSIDAEVIELAWSLLMMMGLTDLTLKLNSIGDSQCKPAYIEKLSDYYRSQNLTHPDCVRRLQENPLRLLDCKEKSCQRFVDEAPVSADHLCGECQVHWNELLGYLDSIPIPYEIDGGLVRGLDYYTRTVFEMEPAKELGQSTILGGGRYDGLIEQIGGAPTPGIGFGMGIERVLLNLKSQGIDVSENSRIKVLVAYVGRDAKEVGLRIASSLRNEGITAVLGPAGRSLKSQMRYAASIGASHAAILGGDEIERGTVVLRDLRQSTQAEIPAGDLGSKLMGHKLPMQT